MTNSATPLKGLVTDEPAAVWVAIDSITPWDDNPRHNEEAIPAVMASIKRFGFASPIIVRTADRVVIAGHTRLTAAHRLGMHQVPVRFMDLDPADARLLAIVDNKSAEVAEWDFTSLGEIVQGLEDADLELLLETGFDEAGLELLLEDPEAGLGQFDNITDAPPEFHTMSFTVSTAQKEAIVEALDAMKDLGEFDVEANTNKNGNALARLADMRQR